MRCCRVFAAVVVARTGLDGTHGPKDKAYWDVVDVTHAKGEVEPRTLILGRIASLASEAHVLKEAARNPKANLVVFDRQQLFIDPSLELILLDLELLLSEGGSAARLEGQQYPDKRGNLASSLGPLAFAGVSIDILDDIVDAERIREHVEHE